MNQYEDMTKDELLAEAQGRGISPANASMTKDELRAALETDDAEAGGEVQPEAEAAESPEQQATTTMTKDYLGVSLVNPTPGTSQATDRLGRAVIVGNKDYYGRNLVA